MDVDESKPENETETQVETQVQTQGRTGGKTQVKPKHKNLALAINGFIPTDNPIFKTLKAALLQTSSSLAWSPTSSSYWRRKSK